LKSCEVNEFSKKSEDKSGANNEYKNDSKESAIIQENQCFQQKEKCRKQWETSPDQIKEITRSLSQINESHFDKTDHELIRNKTCATDKSYDNQVNRSLFPPINTMSDYELGKEQTITCVCDESHKSNTDFQVMDKFNTHTEPQWVVTRPKRNKPKDNLRLEGPMELETTFKTTYESTVKQINDNLAKNVAIVSPSSKDNTNKTSNENLAEKQRQSKITNSNYIKSSKKKSKHRPSTSLKPGGDGYFNTINKESYKNFVIINDNSKKAKPYCSPNGKSVCCATVANIKLPKVQTCNNDDKQSNRRLSAELKSTQIEQIDRSMNRMTTEEIDSTNKTTHRLDTNIDQSSAEILNDKNRVEYKYKNSKQEISRKSPKNGIKSMESENMVLSAAKERINNWTVGNLEEPKRMITRDVDNIKELGILDGNGESIKPQQIKTKEIKQDFHKGVFHKRVIVNSNLNNINGSTRVRNDSKNYVQSESRLKINKNESSMKLFEGDMDFSTTKNSFEDKSSNKETDQSTQRKHTAGIRTRKSGRNKNLFRYSANDHIF
jgi:hypothetical protein